MNEWMILSFNQEEEVQYICIYIYIHSYIKKERKWNRWNNWILMIDDLEFLNFEKKEEEFFLR